MIRSAASKVMRVGRATALPVVLAVMLVVVFGTTPASAHGGYKGVLHLGHSKAVAKATTLVGKVATGSALVVKNPSGGSALDLSVGDPAADPSTKTVAPMKVDSQARVTNLNADEIDGTDSSNLIKRGASSSATPVDMNFYSYFMNTTSGVKDFPFGSARLQTTGIAGQFRVCGNSIATGSYNFVAYVNGTRTAGTVPTTGCSATFDAGAGGDFQVSIRRAQIFGVHSGDGTTNENYNLYGFSQL